MKLGALTLGDRPRIAVAVRDGIARDAIDKALAAGADLIELRIDAFSDTSPDVVREELTRYKGVPTLGTIRGAFERGEWKGSEAERAALYEATLPLVDAIDIEIGAEEINRDLIAMAKDQGKRVIASFHDFDATPSREALEATDARGRSLGADIIKIAAQCNSENDLRTLAEYTLAHRHEGVIAIGMGPVAMSSRVFFPALGSLITYTFLGEATAPGQLTLDDTVRYLSAFYPTR